MPDFRIKADCAARWRKDAAPFFQAGCNIAYDKPAEPRHGDTIVPLQQGNNMFNQNIHFCKDKK